MSTVTDAPIARVFRRSRLTAAGFLDKFEAVEPTGGGRYTALCPLHEADGKPHKPSLAITIKADGRALVTCHRCETRKAELLAAVGLSFLDLAGLTELDKVDTSTASATKRPVADATRIAATTEAAHDANRLFQHVTAEPEGAVAAFIREKFGVSVDDLRAKTCTAVGLGLSDLDDELWLTVTAMKERGGVAWRQRRNIAGGGWLSAPNPTDEEQWDAVGRVGTPRPGATVLFVEGASDAVTVAATGLFDVVAVRGANLARRVVELADALEGRQVVVCFDADDTGREWRDEALAILEPVADSVASIELGADRPKGFDLNDFAREDWSTFPERLTRLVEDATPYERAVDFDVAPYIEDGSDLARARGIVAFVRARGDDVAWTPTHGWLYYSAATGRFVERADARVRQMSHRLRDHVMNVNLPTVEAEFRSADAALKSATATAADLGVDPDPVAHARRERAAAQLKKVKAFGSACGSSALTDRALREASALPGVLTEASTFDADPDLLSVKNGVVDLRTGALRPASPADKMTRGVDVDYRPEATAPRWEAFLREVIVDRAGQTEEDVLAYLRAFIGYSLTGRTDEQAFAVFLGSGANGKSVLVNALTDIFAARARRRPSRRSSARPAAEASRMTSPCCAAPGSCSPPKATSATRWTRRR